MIVETDGLRVNTYTMWLGFFNAPEECTNTPEQPEGLRCGLTDLWSGSFVYADGLVATGIRDRFEVCWPAHVLPEGAKIQSGDGLLTNPLGAEYQSVLRFHGPEDERYMPEQVETHDGGCKGTSGDGAPADPLEGYSCGTSQATGAGSQIPIACLEFPDLEECPPI